ncbi:thiol:disulfide interchange protein DsbA/DsbL [Shewanella sp.]|nr:thiol:disulfide interchange protein DsbA/DsbL [Shewanella sp.]
MIKHIALTVSLIMAPMSSFAAQFIEGKHFTQVSNKAPSSQPKLTEFFSFYCGHCFNMEKMYLPSIKANLDNTITFDSKHVDFVNTEINTEVMRSLAVIQTLADHGPLTDTMFKVIQGENGEKHDHSAPDHKHDQPLKSRRDIQAVFAKLGVSEEQYNQVADSPETDEKLALWRAQQRTFNIQSVPAFVVNDKYAVNMNSIQSLQQFIDLINYLALEHQ